MKPRLVVTFILYLVLICAASAQTNLKSLPRVTSQAEFDSLAVTYYPETPYALPHLLFVIDRQDKNRIYYVNTKKYPFHKDFVNGTYLSLERGREFFDNNYLKPNRRFILGTIAYQTPIKKWTFEFWEGDLIPAEQISMVADLIGSSFFQPVAFKPNSLSQEERTASLAGLARVLQSEIIREQEYQALNIAKGIGRIHIIPKLDERVEIGSNEILVLDEVPLQLPPVAGVITTKPSTPLSHINLLAKGWGIPNAYIKNAPELFKQHDGWWVTFETKRDGYSLKRADIDQLREYQRRQAQRPDLLKPAYDLSERRLLPLGQQSAKSWIAFGGKSANLGELIKARLPGIAIPNGFTIPFAHYDEFIRANKIDDAIFGLLNDQRFVHDPVYRREQLGGLRKRIQEGQFDSTLRTQILRR
ncbi:MAG TPA: PEP/pyruvate-binding domain-containing protein, partial [Pyrinomonadaceae bacterium]|nr:PEP/pyruvate-binding domain-containing protein [Pyrinomonadaceae bacterium]